MEPVIVTETAKNRFKVMLDSTNNVAIRFGIKGGGCSGFSYYLDFDHVDNADATDEIVQLDNGVIVIVDGASVMYILGTTIDWVEDIMGSHFTFKSPAQTSSCGCGSSVSFNV